MRRLQEHYGDSADLFYDKLAFGGHAISNWLEGGYWHLCTVRIAGDERQWLEARGFEVKWLPVIWIQGESDASAGMPAAMYRERLESIIDEERSHSSGTRPWIFQKLSTYQTRIPARQRAGINAAFDSIANGSRTNCYVLDPSECTLTMDPGPESDLHYGAKDLYMTLADEYFELMKANNLLP
jgi:hypothetical protein